MLELRLRPGAQRDLDEIWDYTNEQWSAAQANRYVTQLREEIEKLRRTPTRGRSVDHPAGISQRASGSHIIYRWDAKLLDIIRVLHNRMNLPAHLPANET